MLNKMTTFRLKTIEFDEKQKAALTAGLLAAVESMHQNEIINLLSDDDSTDAEITQNNNAKNNNNSNDLITTFNEISDSDATINDSEMDYTSDCSRTCGVIELNGNNYKQLHVNNEIANNANTSVPYEIYNYFSTINDNILENNNIANDKCMNDPIQRTAYSYSEFDNAQSFVNNEDCNENHVDTFVMAVDESSDSTDNDDMDNETNTKIISLIESDNEECNADTSATTAQKFYSNMLFQYICPACGILCGSYKKWKGHTDIVHKFDTINNLNIHAIINKKGDLCQQCKTCAKKFPLNTQFSNFLQHRISHLPYKNYFKCRLCEQSYSRAWSLRRHIIKAHYNYIKQRVNKFNIKYICPICNIELTNRKQMNTHLISTHDYASKIEQNFKKVNDKSYICAQCDKTLIRTTLFNHLLLHEENDIFQCGICQEYSTKCHRNCFRHINVVHNKLPTSKCNYCDEVFKAEELRWQHMKIVHSVVKLQCNVCCKKFKSPSLLMSHIQKTKHQKLK